MADPNNEAFFKEYTAKNPSGSTTYSNEELQKLIDNLQAKYHATTYHPHRCDLFKKVLELIDVQISRAKKD